LPLTAASPAPLIVSPCIGVCEVDDATGYCRGCARTADEVAAWRDAPEGFREAVWRALPGRQAALGIRIRRLSWDAAAILDFAEASLREARGAWVLGVYGAVGEFLHAPGEPCRIVRGPTSVEAVTGRGAIRIAVTPSTRAMAHHDGGGEPRILLVLPRVRLPAPGPAAFTALGPDRGAIRPADHGALRFDIGLGRAAARFTVRTRDTALAERLAAAGGRAWPGHLAETAAPILAASPARVIETPLGRVEIDTPIPPPGGPAPRGPHTHLLPPLIARGLDVPPGMEVPAAYAAGAIFHP
jgi:predicted Fe-S protein YdhL (DUF1289 family)